MKRMILTLDVEATKQREVDHEALEDLLDVVGFEGVVETDEGSLTVLPTNTYYGEFEDDVTSGILADRIEEALKEDQLEATSLLITEMGEDQVLFGVELPLDEAEGEGEADDEAEA